MLKRLTSIGCKTVKKPLYSVRPQSDTSMGIAQETWQIGYKKGAHDYVIATCYSEDVANLIAGLLNGVARWL